MWTCVSAYVKVLHMSTQTNPFISPKAGSDTATPHDLVESIRADLKKLAQLTSGTDDMDTILEVTALIRGVRDTANRAYNAGRDTLWAEYGPGKHATPAGRTFSFTKPAASRKSCNYEELAKYPEAYKAAVTVTPAKADAVGTLRLSGK